MQTDRSTSFKYILLTLNQTNIRLLFIFFWGGGGGGGGDNIYSTRNKCHNFVQFAYNTPGDVGSINLMNFNITSVLNQKLHTQCVTKMRKIFYLNIYDGSSLICFVFIYCDTDSHKYL